MGVVGQGTSGSRVGTYVTGGSNVGVTTNVVPGGSTTVSYRGTNTYPTGGSYTTTGYVAPTTTTSYQTGGYVVPTSQSYQGATTYTTGGYTTGNSAYVTGGTGGYVTGTGGYVSGGSGVKQAGYTTGGSGVRGANATNVSGSNLNKGTANTTAGGIKY